LLWESFAFSRLHTFAVLGLEAVHGNAEALSSRKGYKQGGFLKFRIMTGRSYFQARNDGIVSHQELFCKTISNTNQAYNYSLACHFDMPEHGICIKKLIQKCKIPVNLCTR
jgi:hypothetical protein